MLSAPEMYRYSGDDDDDWSDDSPTRVGQLTKAEVVSLMETAEAEDSGRSGVRPIVLVDETPAPRGDGLEFLTDDGEFEPTRVTGVTAASGGPAAPAARALLPSVDAPPSDSAPSLSALAASAIGSRRPLPPVPRPTPSATKAAERAIASTLPAPPEADVTVSVVTVPASASTPVVVHVDDAAEPASEEDIESPPVSFELGYVRRRLEKTEVAIGAVAFLATAGPALYWLLH